MATISYDPNGFIIDGKHVVMSGGELHYFRIPPELWETRVRMMAQAGCNLLTTYIPWNFHEEKHGELNWSGDRDLSRFLEICKKYNMYVVVKPGPYICGEWNFGGFPFWFLKEPIEIRVDRPKYMAYTSKWFKDLADVIRPHLVTNGGIVVSIQIENEYDHLMKYRTDITGDAETAKKYILKLLQIARDGGIDIPAFTVEGTPVLGTEIINANTYYPNIPWIVMWVFDYFDQLIEASMIKQPDKPLMVVEAQGGWFSQYGYDFYDLEVEAFEAVAKTVAGYGGSVLNFYMFCGGTNFPYWGSRGDFGGIGMTTTYDFGACIREWGEEHRRYSVAKVWNYFVKCCPEIITKSKRNTKDIQFVAGSGDISCMGAKGQISKAYTDSFAEMKLLLRKGKDYSGVLLRNIEPEDRPFQLKYKSDVLKKEVLIPHDRETAVGARYALFMPLDFKVTSDVKIVYSTSEIALMKKMGDTTYVFLKGQSVTHGEMLLQTSKKIKKLSGDIKISKDGGAQRLSYTHGDVNAFKVDDCCFVIFEREESFKIWMQDNLLIHTDCYHVEETKPLDGGTEVTLLVKNGKKLKTRLWAADKIKKVLVDGKAVDIERDSALQAVSFDMSLKEKAGSKVTMQDEWKFAGDTAEAAPDYDDSSWDVIAADKPLERDERYEQGYFWYRHQFQLDGDFSEIKLDLKMNDIDRYLLYINGRLVDVNTKSIACTPEKDNRKNVTEFLQKGKNTVAVLYANEYHPKAHPHEGPVQKVSGLFEPITFLGKVDGKDFSHTVDSWKLRFGLQGNLDQYQAENFDDSKWPSAPVADKYVVQESTGNVAWLRRSFTYQKKADWESPMFIRFPKLKERCMIYVNGVAIGRHEDCGPQTEYYVPDNILKENNQLTLQIEGPCLHYRKHLGFRPAFFRELEFGFYYTAKRVSVVVK
ncbi:beta-galactosidase [Candidatus Sumerlaeota bacterium]|nr:beta-galactosidase [Candidatus Sumerlaeota bacterium]